ncbi:MAG: FAD:protein FMN transferase [Chthoniobacterales bacterium]
MSRCVELRRARPLLGTFVEIASRGIDEAALRHAIEKGFAAVAKVHRLMSFHDENSDVARLNRDAAKRPVRVSSQTWLVLQAAQQFAAESDGAFDITVAPLLVRWKYLPFLAAAERCEGTWRDIVLEEERTVRFRRPLLVDLGGIAKGFAVDCAVRELKRAGVCSGSVNAGGDLRVFGDRAETIHLRDSRNPGLTNGAIVLRQRSIATSATCFSRRRNRGGFVSALVDGRTRDAVSTFASVTVSARDCLNADALTKIVLALHDDAGPILTRHKADALIAEFDLPPSRIAPIHAPRSD